MKKTLLIVMALMLAVIVPLTASAADSPVMFKVASTQISVTVPTNIVGTVDWETGAITFPEATSTLIENDSVFKIHVESIQCAVEGGSGWTLAEAGGAVADTIVATIKTDVADVIEPGIPQTAIPLVTASKDTAGTYWDMDAHGGTDDELGLTLAGAIYNAGDATASIGTTEATAFTITFTVAAGANT